MFVEPRRQTLDVRRSAVRVADRVELEDVVGDVDAPKDLGVQLDHFSIDRRIVRADGLDGQLPVLAVTSALRAVVAPHRADRVELLRLRLTVQTVLEVRAADGRSRLGPQRQGATAAIHERVRLLLDDVGTATRGADDQLRVLDARRVDAPIAVERTDLLHLSRHPLPERLLGREDVVRAARRLEARHARSSARNGLRASSAPSVVSGPWPEKTTVSYLPFVRQPISSTEIRDDRKRGEEVSQRLPPLVWSYIERNELYS